MTIGWYGKYGKYGLTVKPLKIQEFIDLDPFNSKSLELVSTVYEGKRSHWLRIGKKDIGNSKPAMQIKLVKNGLKGPPRNRTNNAKVKFFSIFEKWIDACEALLEDDHEEADIGKEIGISELKHQPSNSMSEVITASPRAKSLMLSQLDLDRSYQAAKVELKKVKTKLFLTDEECMEASKYERMQVALSASLDRNAKQSFSVAPDSYPVLQKYGINPTSRWDIQAVLADLLKLQRDVWRLDNFNIFKVASQNNTVCNLVEIPSSTNWDHFRKNVNRKDRPNWISSILDTVFASPTSTTVEEDDSTVLLKKRSLVALWIMKKIGAKYSDEFIETSADIGMLIPRGQMSVAATAAMWDASGTSYASQRVICSYFYNHYGWRFCAPEQKVRSLGNTAMEPTVADYTLGDHHGLFWYKDLDKLLCHKVVDCIKSFAEADIRDVSTGSMDVLVGADHGQGALRAVTKFLLRSSSKDILAEHVYSLAEVECKKDNAALVNATIGPLLKHALKRMVKYSWKENEEYPLSDGTFTVFQNIITGSLTSEFNSEAALHEVPNQEVLFTIPIRVIMTGDIKFYTTMLGMEDHEGYWCWLCYLSKKEWQVTNHLKGRKRKLKDILEVGWSFNGVRPDRAEKGVIMFPPIDCIEPIRYVIPPLHIMLGITNQILKEV